MWNHNTELQVHDGETMLLKHNDLSRGILRIKRWLELEASESLLFMLQNSEYKLERLAIDPLEVRFPFEVDRDVSCVLQLTNRSPDFVAFTALANQSRYRTVPGRGVMPPWSKLYVVATLQAQGSPPANMRCDDLFVVQSAMVIGRREGSAAIVDDDVVEGLENMMGEAVEEVRLPIVYVAIREQQDTNS